MGDSYEEIATPECKYSFILYIFYINVIIIGLFCGSVYVNFYAKKFLGSQFLDSFKYPVPSDLLLGFLNGSPFEGDLDEIVKSFDRSTKPRFKTAEGFQYIKFGGSRDNDPAHNIRLGQLKLPGSVLSQNLYSNVAKNTKTGLT